MALSPPLTNFITNMRYSRHDFPLCGGFCVLIPSTLDL